MGIFSATSTKSALKKLLKKGFISVNEEMASTATFVQGGEQIQLRLPEEAVPKKLLNVSLEIIYEDDYLAAIYKPAGILVSGNKFKTVANALTQNLKSSEQNDATIPQPVHRLDYVTTGILLVGKTSSAIRLLNQLFERNEIRKTYLAICIGEMKSEGSIQSEIDGKDSHSGYRVLESVSSERFGKLNLVELKPQSGRRHQLRIHLSSIANPILGDQEYGIEPFILKGKGVYLHAFALEFTHPFTQEEVFLKTEIPERFRKIFGKKDQ